MTIRKSGAIIKSHWTFVPDPHKDMADLSMYTSKCTFSIGSGKLPWGTTKKKKRQALAFHIDDFFPNLPKCNEQHLSCPSAIYLSSLHYKIRSFSSIQVCEISVKVASGIYIEFSGMPFLSTYSKESTGQTSTKIGSFRGKQLHIANKIGKVQSLLVS